MAANIGDTMTAMSAAIDLDGLDFDNVVDLFNSNEKEDSSFRTSAIAINDNNRNLNSEKRKEKSRKAAKERRSQEAKIFDEIEEILPVPSKILDHLDKASLVRIAINYLKIRAVVDPFQVPNTVETVAPSFDLSNTLDGFLFVLSKDGDIIYLSENVDRFLGLTQIDLMGQSIYDYSHPCDHDDIKCFLEHLNNAFNASRTTSKLSTTEREASSDKPKLSKAIGETVGPYFIRMKCTLTNKGRNLNLKSANYKVIKCTGRMIDLEVANPKHAQMIGENYRHYMIAVAESILIQHPSRIEIPLTNDVFFSKHSPDMKFSAVEDSVKELFGYDVNDLIGTSFYQYFDAEDFNHLSGPFKTLFAKGQCDFGKYKFLAKTGGYRWISTQATVIPEPNSNHPQSIILIHQVISNIENAHQLTSNVQQPIGANTVEDPSFLNLFKSKLPLPILNNSAISTTSSTIVVKAKSSELNRPPAILPKLSTPHVAGPNPLSLKPFKVEENEDEQEQLLATQVVDSITDNFISSTETVLAPKTADMESGFLVFTEDNKGLTVLSDADDLTHLAPDAGDLCVPMLPDMDFSDMNIFDEMFLNSTSFNITANGALSEDDFLNNLASLESEKLKLDGMDNFNLELENGTTSKKFSNENLMGIKYKDLKSMGLDQPYPLDVNSNDPFLSFSNNANDEFLISDSPTARSDCSMNDSFTSNSPINSSSSSSLQFSPQSMSCDESASSRLCDSDDKDLEMRAPFIPIDDDYLLNDFSCANLEDLFDWISNNDGNNSQKSNNKSNGSEFPYGHGKKPSIPKPPSGCLEALLQNDELICNLKNKMYSSNQILSGEQQQGPPSQQSPQMLLESNRPSPQLHNEKNKDCTNINTVASFPTEISESHKIRHKSSKSTSTNQTMKRKNSNIFVYTTMSNTGEKKIKNLILTPDIPHSKLLSGNGSTSSTASIHHFVLTKDNELIPKVTFVSQQPPPQQQAQHQQQQQPFKVPKRMVMTQDLATNTLPSAAITAASQQLQESIKENVFKKPRSDSVKNFSSNSVLLNLLVNGSDLSNGYELSLPNSAPVTTSNNHRKMENSIQNLALISPGVMMENPILP